MTEQQKIFKAIKEWVATIGPKKAAQALVAKGIGLSTAQKLVYGHYESTPAGATKYWIQEVLNKDGFNI